MGTRTDPGRFDCYATARPDEEMLILLARDAIAAPMTRLWGAIREGNRDLAFAAMIELQGMIPQYQDNPDTDKALEAYEISARMRTWRSDNLGAWRQPHVEGQPA